MRPRALLLDLDGTVHRGGAPTPGAVETLRDAHAQGVALRYLTNNSTVDNEEVAALLDGWAIPAEPGWVYGTAREVASLAAEKGLRRAYVIGERVLVTALARAGVESVTEAAAVAGQATCVVQGLCRDFTYRQLRAAHRALQQGAAFLATNRDRTFPVEDGWLDPGSGALTAALAAASGVEPEVVGKPSPRLVLRACADLGVLPSEALVVGDRADTDLESGRAAGAPTWLVLTGVEQALPPGQPGSDDLTGLRRLWA